MKNKNYILISFLLVLLVLVRLFEESFFDDHLLSFFNYSYLTDSLPKVPFIDVYKIISLRYLVNSLISILILYLFFPEKNVLKFLFYFFVLAFFILSGFLYYEWHNYVPGDYLLLFYVRRLLIQPVFLFILIPALLFHQMEKKS